MKRERSKSDCGPLLRINDVVPAGDEGTKKYARSPEGKRDNQTTYFPFRRIKMLNLFNCVLGPYPTVKFFCKNCDKELNIRETVYLNWRPHMCKTCLAPLSFICKKCGKDFKTANGAYIHGNKVCGVKPTLECELCSFKTWYKNELKKHIRSAHDSQ